MIAFAGIAAALLVVSFAFGRAVGYARGQDVGSREQAALCAQAVRRACGPLACTAVMVELEEMAACQRGAEAPN